MRDIILKKIDNIISKTGDRVLHIPPCQNGKYFDSDDGKYELSHILATNQAYITGMAIKAYKITGDEKYLNLCHGLYDEYREKVDNRRYDASQDVGMLYWNYAVPMYEITGDQKYKELSLMAADALSHRFIPPLGFIKAWGRADGNIPPYIDDEASIDPYFSENRGLLLIETLANLPILAWAHWETRLPFYLFVADCHVDNVFKYLVRGDGTTCHGFRFKESLLDPATAYVEENYFGYFLGSYWSRGVSLAVYGLSLMQKFLNLNNPEKTKFLNLAIRLIMPFIDACAGELPPWDFASPDKTVDTCSAAIMLCAVQEIQKYRDNAKINAFGQMLSDKLKDYINTDLTCDGILTCQHGKNQYDIMGDYFIAEAFLKEETK